MMELSAVAPRITHLRHVMKVIVQIQESVTQLSVVRMRPAMVSSPGKHVVLIEDAILLATVCLNHQKSRPMPRNHPLTIPKVQQGHLTSQSIRYADVDMDCDITMFHSNSSIWHAFARRHRRFT